MIEPDVRPVPVPPAPMRLACLISGGGRTVLNLREKIAAGELAAEIMTVVADRPCTGVGRCRDVGLPVVVRDRGAFASPAALSERLWEDVDAAGADVTVLCGFLSRLVVPRGRELATLNIHPSLLPAFGGVGMYGTRVHAAAIRRGVRVSGCTVHFVTDEVDDGPILHQAAVPVRPADDPDALAARVFAAECEALPSALTRLAAGGLAVQDGRVVEAAG